MESARFAVFVLATACLASSALAQSLPAVPVPPENPITEEKRVLGKILFWEEQLSSDGTVACGTCHGPAQGGAEPDSQIARHPGPDEIFETDDDVFGSFGVVRRDSSGAPIQDPLFGFDPQVTRRTAPNFFGGALWAPEILWDGANGGTFVDPLTSTVLIASGGALESQAIAPLLNDVEMAKEGRTWAEVTSKLAAVTPLATAIDLPPDMAAAIAASPTYPGLFEAAFGDPALTPARIAFAIATYQRTLVPDQTPWDAFVAGDTGALTANQQTGLQLFDGVLCSVCHMPPLFTDHSFRNIGVRPPDEDTGREGVTGNPDDLGRFKVPTLRNAALKHTFMHNGRFFTIDQVLVFYRFGPHSTINLDPLIPLSAPIATHSFIKDFVENGLVDPRVANESFPFDRPTLLPEPAVLTGLAAGGLLLAALSRLRSRRR